MTTARELGVVSNEQPEENRRPAAHLSSEVRDMLADLAILRYLPAGVLENVIESFEPVSYTFGMPIVREGEPAPADS